MCSCASRTIEKLCTWFAVNKLSLNVSKSSYMLSGKINAQVDMIVNGINIDRVRVAKFIGVLIYEEFNWKEYIANKCYCN